MNSLSVAFVLAAVVCFSGCDPEEDTNADTGIKISEVSIPSEIKVVAQGNVTISGKGFAEGDQFKLISDADASQFYIANATSVDNQSASFALPEGVLSGKHRIVLVRGDQELLLGSTIITIIVAGDIPDKAGMTVKGVVYSNGEGIPNVVVSDGHEVTVTDENGVYYLASEKKNGYVFISVPGNYEVASDNNIPQFFKRLSGGASVVEQKDFALVPANNSKHVIVTSSDWHLANRNDDLAQFHSGFVPDANAVINEYTSAGTKVYGLAMGDVSWDIYWYDNNFGLSEYLAEMKKINCTMFNVIGNHDHDPYIANNDWEASKKYREIIGPTYYSFNLGDVHYVVLDDIDYVNTGGAQGVVGQRNYGDIVLSPQIEWLKKDLAMVQDKSTPVIVSMHAPLYRTPTLDANAEQVNTLSLNNGNALLTALQGFTEVHFITGHIHANYTVKHSESITEHNTAAVCATWWWTGKSGYAGNHICKDGSPGGYGVWEVDGRNIKWYYKSIGKPKTYQFRTYDLNQVYITSEKFAPNATAEALAPYAGVYANPNLNNEVLVNVWGYGPDWKVEVSESGTALPVTRVSALDPLHIISYEAKRLNAGAEPTDSFVTDNTSHLFKVTASGATTTLEIKVTDRFGTVYTETMQRPKEFTYLSN